MKEQNENETKKPRMNREKKFYLFTAIACAAVLIAIIVVAIAVTGEKRTENEVLRPPVTSENTGTSEPEEEKPEDEKPVGGLPDGMIAPVGAVNVSNDFGFYHNQTLNSYYAHSGMDFAAEVGADVFAVEDGVVESIYKDDLLSGTEIVVSHADGLKSVYRFVTEAEGLKVGSQVKKGDVIATIAEATGNEYKDGAHLHFEIWKDGKSVDPALHLTLDEK